MSGKMGKWGNFNVGAGETKKGYFMMNKNRQSIFKSPEGVDGKVNFFLSEKTRLESWAVERG